MKSFNHLLSTIFLLSLGILAFISIFSSSIFGFDITQVSFLSPLYFHLSSAQYAFVALAIMSGALLFYANRDQIESIEQEQEREIEEEERRRKEFDEKYRVLSRVPVVGWVSRWMYGEKKWFIIGYISIFILFLVIRFGMPIVYTGSYIDEYYQIFS